MIVIPARWCDRRRTAMEMNRMESLELRTIGKFRFRMLPMQKRIRRQLQRIRGEQRRPV